MRRFLDVFLAASVVAGYILILCVIIIAVLNGGTLGH